MNVKKASQPARILVLAGFSDSLVNFRGPLIKALSERGLEVHAAAPNLTHNTPIRKILTDFGAVCHDVPFERTGTNPMADLRVAVALCDLIRAVDPDITFAYTIKPVIYGTLAAWLVRVPKRYVLITGLGYTFSETLSIKSRLVQWVARKLYGMALSRASLVFFQNPDDEAVFKKLRILPAKVTSFVVNGSGVDLARFPFMPLPKDKVIFLLIARLLGAKGVREYIVGAKEIRKQYPDTVFRLVGSPDDNPDSVTDEEVRQWQSEGVIEYLGWLEDVRPAIEGASVYVLPSYYPEGTPRTVLEAMAMGRPIITTDAPGCRETVVDGENGFLVPVKNVEKLTEAMMRFVEHPTLVKCMGQRSREIAEEKYDVHKVNSVMLREMGITL